jgi:hypothetical protein
MDKNLTDTGNSSSYNIFLVSDCTHEHDGTQPLSILKGINDSRPVIEREPYDEVSDNESFQLELDIQGNPDDSDLRVKIDVNSVKSAKEKKPKKIEKESSDEESNKEGKNYFI